MHGLCWERDSDVVFSESFEDPEVNFLLCVHVVYVVAAVNVVRYFVVEAEVAEVLEVRSV